MSKLRHKYVVAVSGGVDSVALLHMLKNDKLTDFEDSELIVTHLDHGIRLDSAKDRELVEELAKSLGLKFECERVELGPEVSEATAREVRYNFLRQVCKKYSSSAIITAHHQDDLIETAIINLLRGSSWRGLCSLKAKYQFEDVLVLRPILDLPKSELVDYAKLNDLSWNEDSTNQDQNYLRNYIRHSLIPAALKADSSFNKKMLKTIKAVGRLRPEIENELITLTANYKTSTESYVVPRHHLVMWPITVAKESIYFILRELDADWHPESLQVKRVLTFCKTAHSGKELQVSSNLIVRSGNSVLTFSAKR